MQKLVCSLFAAAVMSVAGCASSSPTFGDRMQAEGESKIAAAEQWEKGKAESRRGEKQIRAGRKLVEKGRRDLRKGEQLVASGNVAVQMNRQAYQGLSQTTESANTPESAASRASKLKAFSDGWKKGERSVSDGNALIKRGGKLIAEGESEIKRGQRLVESGRKRMQAAENKYPKSS